MGQSKNPAKKAAAKPKRSSAKAWKSKTDNDQMDLELPSGNVALCRRIKPEAFIESGMIPDPIAPIIQKAIQSKKGMPPKEMEKLQEDPEKLVAAIQMFDRVLVYSVVEPAVELPPVCEECHGGEMDKRHLDNAQPDFHKYQEDGERDEDTLYADDVDLEDKMFIFQWCVGGAADIASFRKQLESAVEPV